MKENFSEILKRLLKRGDQTRLAERLGIQPQAVQQWQAGKTEPDLDKIPEIAKFLKTSKEELLESLIIKSNNEKITENNNVTQKLASHNVTLAESLHETPEFKEVKRLLDSIGTDLESASMNQLLVISKILKMKDENVSNTNELIEFIERLVRENSTSQ